MASLTFFLSAASSVTTRVTKLLRPDHPASSPPVVDTLFIVTISSMGSLSPPFIIPVRSTIAFTGKWCLGTGF